MSKTDFPFVTVKNFEVYGSNARLHASSDFLAWVPYVEETEREAWDNYSVAHEGWIEECRELFIQKTGNHTINFTDYPITPHVYEILENGSSAPSPSLGMKGPTWQMSPPPLDAAIVNFDTLSVGLFNRTRDILEKTRGK